MRCVLFADKLIIVTSTQDQLVGIKRVCFGFVDSHFQSKSISMPLSISSLLDEITKPLTIQFEYCKFEPRQAEQLAQFTNKDSVIRFVRCDFPLDENGHNIFMKHVNMREYPIKIHLYLTPIFVGNEKSMFGHGSEEDKARDEVFRKVAGLMMMKHLAKNGKISQLSIDTDPTDGKQTYGYDELVEYLEIKEILGEKLLDPHELMAATGVNEHLAGVIITKFYSEKPAWEGRHTKGGRPCVRCQKGNKFCRVHDWKVKAAAVVEELLC